MSDEGFNKTLARTESLRQSEQTAFQKELIKAIKARSARQRSSEYSQDFGGDDTVPSGICSDNLVDENSVQKTLNDFFVSDNEKRNSSTQSFLEKRKSNTNIIKDKPIFSIKRNEEMAPRGSEDTPVNSSSVLPQNGDQKMEKETIEMQSKPRSLEIKSRYSGSVTTAIEKSKSCQVTTDDIEEKNEKTSLIVSDDFIVHPPLLKSQSLLISTHKVASAKKKAAKREKALVPFEAWKAMKDNEAKIKAAQKRLEDNTKKKTEEENAARKQEAAQKAFQRWKEKKMEYLKKKNKKEKEYKSLMKEKQQEALTKRMKENEIALEKWNAKKEVIFKAKAREKRNVNRKEELKSTENKDKQVIDECEKCLNPCFKSLSSSYVKKSLGDSFLPEFEENTSIKDVTEDYSENYHALKLNENKKNSPLRDSLNKTHENSKDRQVTTDDCVEENEITDMFMGDDLTVDRPSLKPQSLLIFTDKIGLTKDPCFKTLSTSHVKDSLHDSLSPVFEEKTSTKEDNKIAENSNSLRLNENQENSLLTCFVTTAIETSKSTQVTADDTEEENEIYLIVSDDLIVHPPLLTSQSPLISSHKIKSAKKKAAKREKALVPFEAWKTMKDNEAKIKAAQKRLEDNTKKKTEEENAARKKEAAQKAFQRWKEKKMEYLKEKKKKEKEYEKAMKPKQQEAHTNRMKDNEMALKKWNPEKEIILKAKAKEKIIENRKEDLKITKKKDKEVIDEYEKYLKKKGETYDYEKKEKKYKFSLK